MGSACRIELSTGWVDTRIDELPRLQRLWFIDEMTRFDRRGISKCRGSGAAATSLGGSTMGIGGSIFLLALGAILAFAVNADISGLDINIVGYVLMLAGLIGLIITVWYWNSRRQRTTVVQQRPAAAVPPQPVHREGEVVEEYRETSRRQPPPPPQYGA
jgi:hypothetical protein